MPSTPTGTTHASASPNREPTTALVTRSPMSRNPPMAVRMPSAHREKSLHQRYSGLQGVRRRQQIGAGTLRRRLGGDVAYRRRRRVELPDDRRHGGGQHLLAADVRRVSAFRSAIPL